MKKKRDIRGHLITAIESLSVNLVLMIILIRSLEARDSFRFALECAAFGLTLISLIGIAVSLYGLHKQKGKN